MSPTKSDFDTPWKEILKVYFKEFIAYCWPEKYPEIDWKKGYKMLDKELSKISRNTPIGNRIVDKLIEVYRQDGQIVWILIHLEIQRKADPHFGERILIYRYRLRDLYCKPIASIAILIDNDPHWRPTAYKEALWDSSLEIRFSLTKLIDYRTRIQELKVSTNPFALVILAQLAALEKQPVEARLINKLNLTRRLYTCGWKKEDMLNIYHFIDWVIALPPPLEIKYQKAIDQIEEELHVAYMTKD